MAGGGGGGGDGGGGAGAGGGGGGGAKRVPMRRLFTFADRLDAALMAVGGVAAVANGVAMPFLAFLIGELVDAFGAADRAHVVHVVSKVSARDLSLSLSLFLCAFCPIALLPLGHRSIPFAFVWFDPCSWATSFWGFFFSSFQEGLLRVLE